jgi:hypothetical protein
VAVRSGNGVCVKGGEEDTNHTEKVDKSEDVRGLIQTIIIQPLGNVYCNGLVCFDTIVDKDIQNGHENENGNNRHRKDSFIWECVPLMYI